MLNQGEYAPAKNRIGRLRFLLELVVSSVLLKTSAPVDGVLSVLVFSLGFSLAIWASVRRLRDINQSAWWVSIMVAAIPLGAILGLTGLQSSDGSITTFVKIVAGLYMVIYIAYLGVLLFKPSAFPKDTGAAYMADDQPSTENCENAPRMSGANTNATSRVDQKVLRLNGWQRIGVVLSVLWCFGAVGSSANDYYKAYSIYSSGTESAAQRAACIEKAKTGSTPEQSVRECRRLLTWTEVTGLPVPERPSFPPVLPILALAFLPIAVGWLLVFIAIWATKWVREGFKTR